MKTRWAFKMLTTLASNKSLTLAKNLISCSWGDFSTRPLLTTASAKHIQKHYIITITLSKKKTWYHGYYYITCYRMYSLSLPHSTKMSDKLLGNFHPFQQLLQETIRKSLLDGGNVRLHIFQAPEVKQSLTHCYENCITICTSSFWFNLINEKVKQWKY